MVKLDTELLKYLQPEHYRVLSAIEMGMKNHELVPTELIETISGIRAGCYKAIQQLHKWKLIRHDSKPFDGYKLKYAGYDCLAIRAMVKRGNIAGIGRIIGMGKESDVFEVVNLEGETLILKLHRLGRTSFRKIKEKRDYHRHRKNAGWLYLSRLSATAEFEYMKALEPHDFEIPTPIDHNRHAVLMTKAPGVLMNQIKEINNPGLVYTQCMDIIVRLAEHGLIHCDFNEFNLIVDKKGKVTLIDFPQMVSTNHPTAVEFFNRDVQCIITFFGRRFGFASNKRPVLDTCDAHTRLDAQVEASGFNKEASGFDMRFPEEAMRVNVDKITEEEEVDVKEENSDENENHQSEDEEDQQKETFQSKKNKPFRNKKRQRKQKKQLSQDEIKRRVKTENSRRKWRAKMKGSRKSAATKKMKRNTTQDIKEHFI